MSVYIYILMITVTVCVSWRRLTNENEEELVTWFTSRELNWSEDRLNISDKVAVFCDIDFKEVECIKSDSCEWRCGRISRWAGFREKRRWSEEHLSRQQWSEIVAELATCSCNDRLQVAVCEPVEVDDDCIFGRQRINDTDRIFVRWTLLASRPKHRSHALLMARAYIAYCIYDNCFIWLLYGEIKCI